MEILQIEREYLRLFGQQMQAGIDTVDVMTCAVLVAEIVQGYGHEPIGQHQVGWVRRLLCGFRETVGKLQRLAEFSIVELIDAQAPKGAQPVILVIEPVCQFKRRCKRRASSPCATLSVHQRPAQRRQQLHAQALVAGLIELCQCQLGALATLAKQGEAYQ